MIATKVPPQPLLEAQLSGLLAEAPRADESSPNSSDRLPNSERVYAEGTIYKDIRVPMREIGLAPTKSFNGQLEVNEPVRVYDTSGPWGDPGFKGHVEEGLPPLRADFLVVDVVKKLDELDAKRAAVSVTNAPPASPGKPIK